MAEVGDELDIVLDDQEGLAGTVELGQRRLDLADAVGLTPATGSSSTTILGCGIRAAASATSFFCRTTGYGLDLQ